MGANRDKQNLLWGSWISRGEKPVRSDKKLPFGQLIARRSWEGVGILVPFFFVETNRVQGPI